MADIGLCPVAATVGPAYIAFTMKRSRFLRIAAVLGAALALPAVPAWADTYPDKPVRIVNPFPPGSPVDAVGRLIAQRLGGEWPQPVIVESRSGAGGTVGAGSVAKSAPDGATLLVSTQSPITVAPLLYKNLSYDPVTDLVPVWAIPSAGLVVVVTSSLPVRTLGELVQYAKANPTAVAYASSGAGTVQHLGGELFKARTGAPLLHVPYRGGAPAANDLIAGQVQVMFDSLSNQLTNIRAGRVRALAVMRTKRAPVLPDVPTVAEAGAPGVLMRGWIGLFAPKGLPAESLQKLRADTLRTMRGPEVQRQLLALGMDGEPLDGETFGRWIQEDTQQVREIVRAAKIELDAPSTR